MNMMTRWDPRREAMTFREAIDRMFDEPFGFRFPEMWRLDQIELKVDLLEDENSYVVKASIPGVKPEEVEVTLQHNLLTIKGEVKESSEVEEKNYHMRERRYGSFMRSLMLPSEVNADAIEAKHEDGVLTVRLPKVQVEKATKIAVKAVGANGKAATKIGGNGKEAAH
jgi:HSP20 family protein